MTDLRKLRVSLTKHGAHKLAILLRKYNKNEVLNHLVNSEPGVNIELAQAKKNLSFTNGAVPDVWDEARAKGRATLDALVLLSIIFGHYDLINAFKKSKERKDFSGTVMRSDFTNEKAYTNIAHTVEELGYSVGHNYDQFHYDFQKIFSIPDLHKHFEKILRLKLLTAGWDQRNSITEESTALGLHEVLSLTPKQFSSWLITGSIESVEVSQLGEADAIFFSEADDDQLIGSFIFQPGHNPKKTGVITTKTPAGEQSMMLLHNQIQTKLYDKLVTEYGAEYVGTEVPTGDGTSIDIVVKTDTYCCFYEIKTSTSVRVCIRQAIPQLLEYAYWQGDASRADKLIIISTQKITPQAEAYLKYLRTHFKLNIHYEQFTII